MSSLVCIVSDDGASLVREQDFIEERKYVESFSGKEVCCMKIIGLIGIILAVALISFIGVFSVLIFPETLIGTVVVSSISCISFLSFVMSLFLMKKARFIEKEKNAIYSPVLRHVFL